VEQLKHLTLPITIIRDFGGALFVMVLKMERISADNSNAR
jgi:hypothetical protein